MKQWLVVTSLFLSQFGAFAVGFKGSVSFTDADRARHAGAIEQILTTAAECLESDLARHQDFYRRHGVSAYYGDRSAFGKMNIAQRRAHLRSLGKDPSLADQMQPTSCVGLTRKCLGRGFAAVGQSDLWSKIDAYTLANAVDGTAMQDALQKLGWRILYWNPDLRQNAAWDANEKRNDPTNSQRLWGYHAYRWATIRNSGKYYFNTVDDSESLVNFGRQVPRFFAEVPFFVGTAHTGYHVFPGSFGRVIEGHSTRAVTDAQTIETSAFNPLATGGGPRGEYFSGLIALPPGY